MLTRSAVAIVANGIAVALVGVTPVSAETSAVSYCQALADKYQRYVGTDSADLGRQRSSVRVSYAISQCKAGDDSAATPVLEKALTDAKIGLPQRN